MSETLGAQPTHPGAARTGPGTFDNQPRLVFWEMTKACPLACVHCRAFAQPSALPGELTTQEGLRLVDELSDGPPPHPVLILTGGDCFSRPDLMEVVAHARRRGVPVAVAPSVSSRLTSERLAQLRSLGVAQVSLSLDGASARTHDGIRQVDGHFDDTVTAIRLCHEAGLRVQINTVVMARNATELADVAALLRANDVRIWEVFFLVNVGRGNEISDVTAEQAEDVCHFLVDVAERSMVVRTVEAPFFRRVVLERAAGGGDLPRGRGPLYKTLAERLASLMGPPTSAALAPTVATRDGKGIVFVAHDGEVYPAGFLPIGLGNVRDGGLLPIYRSHPLMVDLRSANFAGRCGHCRYSDLCGGSRSRGFAATGDPLADDPACPLAATPA